MSSHHRTTSEMPSKWWADNGSFYFTSQPNIMAYTSIFTVCRSILKMYLGNLKVYNPQTVCGEMPTAASSVARTAATNSWPFSVVSVSLLNGAASSPCWPSTTCGVGPLWCETFLSLADAARSSIGLSSMHVWHHALKQRVRAAVGSRLQDLSVYSCFIVNYLHVG